MAISGDFRVSAALGPSPTNPLRINPPPKVDSISFLNGGSNVPENTAKWSASVSHVMSKRCHARRPLGIISDYEISTSSINQDAESFLLNAINMNFFELSEEAKQKIVSNIVNALSDFVVIESQDKVQFSVSTDAALGTIYSVTVPVRRVKAEYQEEDGEGTIMNVDYKDNGVTSGSMDVKFDFYVPRLSDFTCFQLTKMNRRCLKFEKNSIQDAISRIRFAPASNNLLISSWDTNLRLYDVDGSKLTFEASGEAALLDCCFQGKAAAFSTGSDCSIIREMHNTDDDMRRSYGCLECYRVDFQLLMYNFDVGISENFGNHDDLATCVEFSEETGQVITCGWDKKINCWDSRSTKALTSVNTVNVAVESMSISGFIVMAAVGSSVNIYDLRKFNNSFYSKCVDIQIKCVQPYLDQGFAAGSVEGRVALRYFNPPDQNNNGNYGAIITGDYDGYVTIWNAESKKRVHVHSLVGDE
ncbi:hypothetical protein L1987_61907 [Smallanthus sonchifolius]|uniref:Uncharacterized protein n=1 Tax=Smallanthus sonchifolius TaxID=185202 RepID=A0ACB9C8Y7_9ASTR|nr:hypothetical protein L1987_61907 [Smallanthus sonchifolius]